MTSRYSSSGDGAAANPSPPPQTQAPPPPPPPPPQGPIQDAIKKVGHIRRDGTPTGSGLLARGSGLAAVSLQFSPTKEGPGLSNGGGSQGSTLLTGEGSRVEAQGTDDLLSQASKVLSSTVGLDPKRTVSAQTAEASQNGEAWAIALCEALNLIDSNHCAAALAAEGGQYTKTLRIPATSAVQRQILRGFKCKR